MRLPQPAPREAGTGGTVGNARAFAGGRPGGIVPQAPHATPGISVRPRAMTVAVFMAGLVPVTVCGSANLASMAIIAVLWGATHTSGMLISQVWLTSEASEAPEFANSRRYQVIAWTAYRRTKRV